MELYLVVPVAEREARQKGDEELNGQWWRVTGPISSKDMDTAKFHCVSYVWGTGIERAGSSFDCKRDMSDRTKPALEAAIKAARALPDKGGGGIVDAFWIDALCVPQVEGAGRHGTLESMGYIYSRATSVIVVLQDFAWEIARKASSSNTAVQLSLQEMEGLELDTWVSRVWTYQEMVNNFHVYFTAFNLVDEQIFVHNEKLLNCVGYSVEQWKKKTKSSAADFMLRFPNLNNLVDTAVDANLSGYLERSALAVLTNMAARRYDPQYPGNRILASLGALTQKPSWSPTATLSELAEKVMSTCEEVNDYSFIFTSDERDERTGLGWRPSSQQPERNDQKPAHLIPVLNWCISGEPIGNTQRAHNDSRGLWLDDMIRLQPSETLRAKVEEELEQWLYGSEKDSGHPERNPIVGFFRPKERGTLGLEFALLKAFQIMGFTGSSKCQVCESGLFFSVVNLEGQQNVELYAASSLRWMFGAPGLAVWKEGEVTKYSAGVFAGVFGQMANQSMKAEPLLML